MQFIKKLKSLLLKKKLSDFEKKKTQDKVQSNPKANSIDINTKNYVTSYEELQYYENLRQLKVYRRPIISKDEEREQLYNQISKELNKLG